MFGFLRRKASTKEEEPPVKMIVGLGNPGGKYENTRHNIGFIFMDHLADQYGVKIDRVKFKGLYGECRMGGQKVILLKPSTFMNLSGESVREAVEYFKLSMEDVIIVYDDISLKCGSLRIREKGSAGGHNGIKSIIYQTQTDVFPRIKVGVGAPPHKDYDLADWVLGQFGADEEKVLADTLDKAVKAAELIVAGDMTRAKNEYNITIK